ncbi:MAG: bifunctional methylenetetrahydrofolate dehydrogenase/methenyltetrahydrofolate cyclohydrolase FolD [Verrucomicrobiota bacterium JB022]|nr:bifunctional methylenetetrahydrofolate dehydrogenase/methenyltetrahydrofolate cyclohydrolase FolD [Verrucomicrobiota bacterium JB022]
MAQLIDGNAIAAQIVEELTVEVSALPADSRPCVVFIRVGEDPASVFYVRKKEKTAAQIGMTSRVQVYEPTISEKDLLAEIDQLNADPDVHGILVQAPLPAHMDERTVFNRVSPDKDVDGFSVANLGRLVQEDPNAFVACTPAGVVELLARTNIETQGKHVVVLGRSLIVGKPAALLMMRKGPLANATVTVCHSRTNDLPSITRQADILIAAIGKAEFVTGNMVKPGATVIDVGINRVEDATQKKGYRIAGDVNFAEVEPKVAAITPVPGGVGPMTVAMLMRNTYKAFQLSKRA